MTVRCGFDLAALAGLCFDDCMAYAARPLAQAQVQALLQGVEGLGELADARRLLHELIAG